MKKQLLFILMFQMMTLGINAQSTTVYGTKLSNYWNHWNPTGALDNSQASNGWSALVFNVDFPRSDYTLKGEKWVSRVCDALLQNRVAIEGKSKYYFAPKDDISITTQDGTTYTISPRGDSNQNTYNKLFTQGGDQFTWNEATLGDVLSSHSIVYGGDGAGVFNNDILYAYANGKYTPIVRLTQEQDYSVSSTWSEAGSLELVKYLPVGSTVYDFQAGSATENTVLYDVLNAIGYPNLSADGNDYSQCDFEHSYKNINRQLRAWLGYVKNDGNNVAQYVEQGKYDDDNKATILVSWMRPLNAYVEPVQMMDGNTGENYIYLIDYLRLYDWRGDKPDSGYMYDDHCWFWGFYNVKEIDVDLRPGSVLTNLNQQQAGTWVPLSSVSQNIQLRTLDGSTGLRQYPFDLTSYLSPDKEAYVEMYMGLKPVDYSRKALFGGVRYENLGSSVLNATILVPVTVRYEFGSVTTMMKLVLGNGGITTKCATPTINVVDGVLNFACDTEGVTFKWNYQFDAGNAEGNGAKAILGGTTNCTVSVYATKDGCEDSDVATANVEVAWGKKGDANADGVVNVADLVTTTNIIMGKDN